MRHTTIVTSGRGTLSEWAGFVTAWQRNQKPFGCERGGEASAGLTQAATPHRHNAVRPRPPPPAYAFLAEPSAEPLSTGTAPCG